MEGCHTQDGTFNSQEQAMPGITSDTPTLAPSRGCLPSVESLKRTTAVSLRVSASELEQIKEAARAAGLPPTVFIRCAALGQHIESRPPIPAINAQAYAQLGRVGGSLNQIAARLNTGERVEGDQLVAVLSALTKTVRALRAELTAS